MIAGAVTRQRNPLGRGLACKFNYWDNLFELCLFFAFKALKVLCSDSVYDKRQIYYIWSLHLWQYIMVIKLAVQKPLAKRSSYKPANSRAGCSANIEVRALKSLNYNIIMKEGYVKQHIVPKCYLDRFAEFKNGKYIIGTRYVDKNGAVKLFQHSTAKVGYEKNFYNVTDKEDEKHWEHYLANEIDCLFVKELEYIISSITLSGDGFELSKKDTTVLSKILISQTVRVPDSFNYVNENLYPRVLKDVKQDILNILPDRIKKEKKRIVDSFEMSLQSQKESYFNYFFKEENLNKLVSILERRIWVVYINDISKTCPFITSDNPVLVENLDVKDRIGVFRNGIADSSTCFFFPLTPSIAVANYSSKGMFSLSVEELNRKVFRLDEEQYIIMRNNRIMNQAFKHSFIPQPLYDFLIQLNN